jgi:soluble lytic murein transglycosylase-like protein
VWADVYAYTASDGAVNLSNVPLDSRYSLLVQEPQEQVIPLTSADKQSSIISNKIRYDRMVDAVAHTYGLESALLHAVISVESRYSPKAVSKKGAMGLMQLMPMVAKYYGVADPLDPLQNLHGGAKYLRYLLKKYNNDRSLALAAYNAGESVVAKYGNRIPPFRETANYVPRVLKYYRQYQVKG